MDRHDRTSRLAIRLALGVLAAGLVTRAADPGPTAGPGFTPVAAADTPANRNSLMGINLNGPADWNSELPFVDAFRLGREWISQRDGEAWGKGPALDLDPDGWVARLVPGCYATAPVLTVDRAPVGTYTLTWEGEGKLELWPGNKAALTPDGPGRARAEVKEPGLMLHLRATDPAKPVRRIRLLMPGVDPADRQSVFRPGFLEQWAGMNTFRFMDWQHTNGSPLVSWAQRTRPESRCWTGPGGIPLEAMIDLCNRQLVNPWFCLPHQADDDCVRQFATLVRDRLDPTLHVYIEYSNEVWNGMFPQHGYAEAKGRDLKLGAPERPWEGAGMYHARRSVEIFRIWEEVFGGRERLVRVIAWQAASGPYWTDGIVLSHQEAYKHCDALAIAPYITMCIGPNTKPSAAEVAGWTVDQVLDHAENQALPESIGWMKTQKAVCDKYGLRLIAYEGGQHLVGVGGGENNDKMTALFQAANAHPRMGALYRRYYNAWRAAGGDLFCTFSSIGQWSKWGSWGLAQHYDDKPADSPKLEATLSWTSANPLRNEPPAISGLADVEATVGQPLVLAPQVTDDGASRLAVLAAWYSDAPDAVTFSVPRQARTEVRFATPGTYRLTLRAADGFARQAVTVTARIKP